MTRDSAVRFFYSHAGYSYDPKTETANAGRWRCARQLAAAERHAERMNWAVEWNNEPYYVCGDLGCERTEAHDHDVVYAVLKNTAGHVLASLGMIEESRVNRERADYRRVVAAELASEAMAQISDEVMEAL